MLRSRKTKILTTVILVVFRGLTFESDADIGEKDSFRSGAKQGHMSGRYYAFIGVYDKCGLLVWQVGRQIPDVFC